MSALGRVRLPLAAFLAAGLAGLGISMAAGDGEDPDRRPRAGAAPAVTTSLRTSDIPATPALRVGEPAPVAVQPRAPVSQQPSAPAPPAEQVESAPPPPAERQAATPQPSGPSLQSESEVVASP